MNEVAHNYGDAAGFLREYQACFATRALGSLSISFSKPFLICRRFDYDLTIHFDEFYFVTTFDATTISQFLRNRHLPPVSDFPFVFSHTPFILFHTDVDAGSMGEWTGRIFSGREIAAVLTDHGFVRQVDPRNTSKRCSTCGFPHDGNRHGEDFECQDCGYWGCSIEFERSFSN